MVQKLCTYEAGGGGGRGGVQTENIQNPNPMLPRSRCALIISLRFPTLFQRVS